MNALEACTIIAFAPNPWDGPWMSRQQVLTRLSESVLTVYSTGAWFVWSRSDCDYRKAPMRGSFVKEDGVWVETPPKCYLRWPRFPAWDKAVLRKYVGRLRRFSESAGSGPLIAYVFHPVFTDYVRELSPDICVYHAYDLFDRMPGWSASLADSQHWLLDNVDLTIASSNVIAKALQDQGAESVIVVPNGADSEAFASGAASGGTDPSDLLRIRRPRIGYTGNLNRKVDFPLIERLAKRMPDWEFVFVGGLGNFDEITDIFRRHCATLSNVHFLGAKDRTELPAYMSAMDVNILCYRTDAAVWTTGIYPLKLHEYLATGRPVVSTDIPSVKDFASVVAIAESEDQWIRFLQEAIEGEGRGSPQMRRQVARQNDWSVRLDVIRRELNELIRNRESGGGEGFRG